MRFGSWIPLRIAAIAAASAVLISLAACFSGPAVQIIRSGASYTLPQAEESARSVPLGAASELTVSQADAARTKALVSLRGQGAEGGRIADLLTSGFPAASRSVPVRVEVGTVAGKAAYIVVEASGKTGGKLTSRRVWVFEAETGSVMGSASFK